MKYCFFFILLIVVGLSGCGTLGDDMRSSYRIAGKKAPDLSITSVVTDEVVSREVMVDGVVSDEAGIKDIKVFYASSNGEIKGEVPATYNVNNFSATLSFPTNGDFLIWAQAEDSSNNTTNCKKISVHIPK